MWAHEPGRRPALAAVLVSLENITSLLFTVPSREGSVENELDGSLNSTSDDKEWVVVDGAEWRE